jgi:hypothetical protein
VPISRPHLALAFVATALAMILSPVRARAGYISVVAPVELTGANSFTPLNASPLCGSETFAATDSAATATFPRLDPHNSPVPWEPGWPSRELPHAANHLGHSSTSGSSSSSSSSKGPSGSQDVEFPRPQMPPLQATSFLPPQTADTHLFSAVSSLFHPPRAV